MLIECVFEAIQCFRSNLSDTLTSPCHLQASELKELQYEEINRIFTPALSERACSDSDTSCKFVPYFSHTLSANLKNNSSPLFA